MNLTGLIHRACPICLHDNKNGKNHDISTEYNLKSCIKCGFVYLGDVPSYEILQKDFSWQQSFEDTKIRRYNAEHVLQQAEEILRRILRLLKLKRDKFTGLVHKYIRQGHVLYIGCGDGHRVLRWSTDIIPYGIEIEVSAAKKADKIFKGRGGEVICDNAYNGIDKFKDYFFNGAVMYAYLEHEINPLGVLKKVRAKMIRNGYLIIKVPNYASINRIIRGKKWCGFRFPEHVNYFTPKFLRTILQQSNYSIERFNFFDRLPVSDNMWLVARAN